MLQLYSPISHISPDAPPFLIIHGLEDEVVPVGQSQTLYDQLIAAGLPAELVLVENAAHGLRPVGGRPNPSLEEIQQIVQHFFDHYFQ